MADVVDEALKHAALAGCVALVQPSFFESFSIVLMEAGAAGRAGLVQGNSDVLAGQVRRSGGGLSYHDFPSFEEIMQSWCAAPEHAHRLDMATRRHVEERCNWAATTAAYRDCLFLQWMALREAGV
jgi:glycosyltransferase involved in cell wall biosynthesis